MTKEEQRTLLSTYVNNVLEELLVHSEHWPDDWDGFELRWLAEEAFTFNASDHRMNPSRHKMFRDINLTKSLY